MDVTRIIREALYYVGKYQGSKVVVKLDRTIIEQPEVLLEIVKDLNLLKASGIEIFVAIAHLGVGENELFSNTPVLSFREDEDTSEDELIAELAISLKADKLVYITQHDGVFAEGKLVRQATTKQTQKLLEIPGVVTGEMYGKLKAAIVACEGGVARVHIISGFRDDAILKEILSCEGVGTMIYKSTSYQRIRRAKEEDILEIIKVLGEQGSARPVALTDITKNLESIIVFTVDGEVHGSVMVTEHKTMPAVEANYLTVSSSYEESDALQRLLKRVIKDAQRRHFQYVVLNAAKNHSLLGIYPWFLKLGFEKIEKHTSKELPWFSDRTGTTKLWVKNLEEI